MIRAWTLLLSRWRSLRSRSCWPDLRDRPDMTLVLASMSGADVFGLIASVLAIFYLLYALVRGEKL